MKNLRSIIVGLVLTITLAFPMAVWADDDDDNAPVDIFIQFGAPHPQPAPPGNHVLVPNEVKISEGDAVTFVFNAGGHGIAIYPVSKKTDREDIEAGLCPGGPGGASCPPTVGTNPSTLATQIIDAKGDLIIDIPADTTNRVNYAPDRVLLVSNGPNAFLTGSTPTVPGALVQHRFEKKGRYLVICINRNHFINDYLFGFINVVDDD